MSTNVIKIEKNIPMPSPSRHGYRRTSRLAFIKEIEVGDSFVINGHTPDITPKSAICSVYSLATKLRRKGGQYRNFRMSIRILQGSSKSPRSVRIWRVA
jgi:hypothetical protein